MIAQTHPLHNDIASTKLLNLFKEYKKRHFILVEPGGNFGDHIIYKGAKKLADIAEINYITIDYKKFMKSDFPKDNIIYIHGGGGFNVWWSGKSINAFRKSIGTHEGITILGPTTFQTEPALLNSLKESCSNYNIAQKVIMFTRDYTSLDSLKNFIPAKVELLIDHDTALNLTRSDFPKLDGTKKQYMLLAIREDKESLNLTKKNQILFSVDPIKFCKNFQHWLFLHMNSRRIITNRLHSAILCSDLNLPVTLLPNFYHKNKSVWEFSLRARNVQWSDEIPFECLKRADNFKLFKIMGETPMLNKYLNKLYYRVNY